MVIRSTLASSACGIVGQSKIIGKSYMASRENMAVGAVNIIKETLVDRKIILPPLHIKLGLMKQFVKALDEHGDCVNYICRSFPG